MLSVYKIVGIKAAFRETDHAINATFHIVEQFLFWFAHLGTVAPGAAQGTAF
jgi:hypothetical protein